MIDTQMLVLLSEYDVWADQTLFAALDKLPEGAVYTESKTLFKTIIGTLNHNYQVELIWQANLCGKAHGFTSRKDLLHPKLEDLVNAQAAVSEWFIDWSRQQTAESLAASVPFTYTSGASAEMTRAAMFMHLINHKTFHRGWVSEMFFDFGSRPPQTDISVYLTEGHVEKVAASRSA